MRNETPKNPPPDAHRQDKDGTAALTGDWERSGFVSNTRPAPEPPQREPEKKEDKK